MESETLILRCPGKDYTKCAKENAKLVQGISQKYVSLCLHYFSSAEKKK